MKQPPTFAVSLFSVLSVFMLTGRTQYYKPAPTSNPKIQVAILLDVSNSMDGLIDQARDQLWNMVKVLGKVRCDEKTPQIEIALYEYGRPENNPQDGYVKQISPFTHDLDQLFLQLNSLKTNGGDEYCGHVMYNSLTQLNWDSSQSSYKVIFIGGNESFLQGDISFTKACEEAKRKGVIINTIYCGDRGNGIKDNWNLGAECGNGSFTNIDQSIIDPDPPTPYDSALLVLNDQLGSTYINFLDSDDVFYRKMMQQDTIAETNANDPSKIIRYLVVRSDKNLYNTSSWDLVDAMKSDSTFLEKRDFKKFPGNLKNKRGEELKALVKTKSVQRDSIRVEIKNTDLLRDLYIAKQKPVNPTLKNKIEQIIREQIRRYRMSIN